VNNSFTEFSDSKLSRAPFDLEKRIIVLMKASSNLSDLLQSQNLKVDSHVLNATVADWP
jgi:hypothetical protein